MLQAKHPEIAHQFARGFARHIAEEDIALGPPRGSGHMRDMRNQGMVEQQRDHITREPIGDEQTDVDHSTMVR